MQNLYVKRNNRPRRSPGGAPDPIERIDALTRAARGTWFSLIAYLAFAGVTLLGVQDIDFFLDSRQTQLPLVGVSIPTREFFLFGPILGAALFIYLHIYLTKLWDALAAAEARPRGRELSTQIAPWLVSDFGLTLRGGGAIKLRPIDFLSLLATFTFVFAAGPVVMFYFWARYWPVHDLPVSLLSGLLFALVLLVALGCLANAFGRLRGAPKKITPLQIALAALRSAIVFLAVLFLTIAKTDGPAKLAFLGLPTSVFETGDGFDLAIASANLREVELTELPDDWLPYDTAKRRFRIAWCGREGLDEAVCGPAPFTGVDRTPHLQDSRDVWCEEDGHYPGDSKGCEAYFDSIEARFEADWASERRTRVGALPRWSHGTPGDHLMLGDAQNRDFRRADFSGAILTGADLRDAQLEAANFSGAQMEGANLSDAWMDRADLRNAQMEAAILRNAQMKTAILRSAQMEGADLRDAQMEEVDLRSSQLEGADFRNALMKGAILRNMQLQGSDLSFAFMEEADLREAKLEGANLSGAQLEGADLREAQLEGANLSGAQMQRVDFRSARMVGADLSSAQMEGADFRFAQMEVVDLSSAQMDGSDLRFAQMEGADLFRAQMEGADLRFSLLSGSQGVDVVLSATNLSAVTYDGGALRYVDLVGNLYNLTEWDALTDFRNAFLDGSVKRRPSFTAQMGDPCQWIDEVLDDETFFGLWRAWNEREEGLLGWTILAPAEWRHHTLPQDVIDQYLPPDCQWKTGPMPGAGP
ncbi:MAG: pentapeptide repeat-containing protein [Pseudomonadota bacterium]